MADKIKRRWSEDKEEVRTLRYKDGKTGEGIVAEGKHGWPIINAMEEMVADGTAPPPPWLLKEDNPLAVGIAALSKDETPSKTGAKAPKPKAAVIATKDFNESSLLNVIPFAFTTTSFSIWLAMEAAKKLWLWPEDMTPGQFLDRFLPMAFGDYGIALLSFVLLPGATVPEGVNVEGGFKLLTKDADAGSQDADAGKTEPKEQEVYFTEE